MKIKLITGEIQTVAVGANLNGTRIAEIIVEPQDCPVFVDPAGLDWFTTTMLTRLAPKGSL